MEFGESVREIAEIIQSQWTILYKYGLLVII